MSNYNERMFNAKKNLDQRLRLERRTREDGEKYATDYFSLNKEKMVGEVLESLIEDMEDQHQCETYFEHSYIIQNEKHFEQSDAYRDGFKEKIVELVSKAICALIPFFKDNLDVMIKERYESQYTIHIIVILRF